MANEGQTEPDVVGLCPDCRLGRHERCVTTKCSHSRAATGRCACQFVVKPTIEATSQTRWADLPAGWRDCAVTAVVDAGLGETPMATIAVVASALWTHVQNGGEC